MINYAITSTPIGKLLLVKSNNGLSHIIFEQKIKEFESTIMRDFPDIKISNDFNSLSSEIKQLTEYFTGKRKTFNIQLDLKLPPFYQKVINKVKEIPYGKYQTYQDIASKAGNSNAYRAAGSANARNPIPIIIPCHRVLAKGGKLGGYGGGIKIKKYLLNLEGIQ